MKPQPTRNCRYCGCPLLLVKDAKGSTIPLDLRSPVYDLLGGTVIVRSETAFVSHFSTCMKLPKKSKMAENPDAS